jgi:hypothetical protein
MHRSRQTKLEFAGNFNEEQRTLLIGDIVHEADWRYIQTYFRAIAQ